MKQLLVAFLLLSLNTFSQQINIIPKPAKLIQQTGMFELSPETVLVVLNKADQPTANFLVSYLKTFYFIDLKVTSKLPRKNYIAFSTWNDTNYADQKESYQLIVSPNFVRITANAHAGTFYGMQTFLQLLPPVPPNDPNKRIKRVTRFKLQSLVIEDEPRFAYRGMHLDVSRHFFPIAFVKKYIDYLALHKLNTFHWHLTDDQGWRIEIKKYPKLTSVGGYRNGTIIGRYPGKGNDSLRYGGFYTQQEIKDVVKYAADRFINVIPEIELPGHSSAAIAAYPELSCFPTEDTKAAKGTAWAGPTTGKQVQQAWGVFDDVFCAGKENTFKMLQDILDEVTPLFPSKYIHIGGDECPKANWKRCPNCQQRLKDQHLKDEHELQSYFIQRIEKYLNSKGKRIIGWDEILEGGLAPNASVMSWRGEQGGIDAAKQNHDVVMTPGGWCYFDKAQSSNEDSVTIGGYLPVEKVYQYDPVPKQLSDEQAKHILGAQANVWTEYIGNNRKVEYMIFPRMAALSEILWTPKAQKDSVDFERRLETAFKRYEMWKANYSKAFWEIKSSIYQKDNSLMWRLTSRHPDLLSLDAFKKVLVTKYDSIQVFNQQKNKIEWIINKPGDSIFSSFRPYDQTLRKDTLVINVRETNTYRILARTGKVFAGEIVTDELPFETIAQRFFVNKATGKKITTTPPPSSSYPGNGGAFGLVNGIRADKYASQEWLGWTKPVEIGIELNEPDSLKEIVLYPWKQEASWIYLPSKIIVAVYNSEEESRTRGEQSTYHKTITNVDELYKDGKISISLDNTKGKYILVFVDPLKKIPDGRQGAGNAAWVFLDEIEID